MKKSITRVFCSFFILVFLLSAACFKSDETESIMPTHRQQLESSDLRYNKEEFQASPGASEALKSFELARYKSSAVAEEVQSGSIHRISPTAAHSSINYFQHADFSENEIFPQEGDPVMIVDYGPKGILPNEMRNPSVFVLFSEPVVPLAELSDPQNHSMYMSIEPAVSGIYRWYGSRLLSFEPDRKLENQRLYQVTVKNVMALNGSVLDESLQFSFSTEPLKMVEIAPGLDFDAIVDLENVPPEQTEAFRVSFSDPVEADIIGPFLELSVDGQTIPVQVRPFPNSYETVSENYRRRTVIIEPDGELPINSRGSITLNAGAVPDHKSIGTIEDQILTFHTLIPFRFISHNTYSWTFPRSEKPPLKPVYLEFNQPVDPDSVAGMLEIGLSEVENPQDYIEVWGKVVRLNNLPVDYDSAFELRLLSGLRDMYGQTLGSSLTRIVKIGAANTYALLPGNSWQTGPDRFEQRFLESAFDPLLIYEFQNITSGSTRIASLEDPFYPHRSLEWESMDYSGFAKNRTHYQIVDIAPHLDADGTGAVQVGWRMNNPVFRNNTLEKNMVVQVTDIGVTVRYSYNKILVWVNRLSSGRPVSNGDVTLYGNNEFFFRQGTTDENGLVIFPLEDGVFATELSDDKHGAQFNLYVKHGDDKVEFKPADAYHPWRYGVYNSIDPWRAEIPIQRTFLFTDRGLYKPGETLTFKGYDQDIRLGEFQPYSGEVTVAVKHSPWSRDVLLEQVLEPSGTGGFHGEFQLPDDLEPGGYSLVFSRTGIDQTQKTIGFKIAEFRRLNFQVNLKAPEGRFFSGDPISVPVHASYLAGGAMAEAGVNWYWTRSPIHFVPDGSGWDNWAFGPSAYGYEETLSSGEGALSGSGSLRIDQDSESSGIPGKTYRYNLEVRVEDLDRQEVASSTHVVVHPADVYIAAKLSGASDGWWSRFVQAGEPLSGEIRMVDIDGAVSAYYGGVEAQLIRREWKSVLQRGVYGRINTRYNLVEEIVDSHSLSVMSGSADFLFTPEKAGEYLIRFQASDSGGRTCVTDLDFYATGSSWVQWAAPGNTEIEIEVEKSLYEVNETARLLVKSPLPRGEYLLTVEREGILHQEILTLEGSANVIDLPVIDSYLPVVYVSLSSQSGRKEIRTDYFKPDLGKPKGFFGMAALNISTEHRALDVEIVNNNPSFKPGEDAQVFVRVTKDGKPVSDAEVVFIAADRGVVDLIDYHIPDPRRFFYDTVGFPLGAAGDDSRRLLLDPVTFEVKNLQGGDGYKAMAESQQAVMESESESGQRRDFRPLAVFEPSLITDKDGLVQINFALPDTLTTYRTTALALAGDQMGYQESELLVQNPINVRTALPRKLRYRDTASAGVVIQNLTGEEVETTIRLSTQGIDLADDPEKAVSLPPGGVYEVSFLLAAHTPGEATLVFKIDSEILQETLTETLTVEDPFVGEAVTVVGVVKDQPAVEGVTLPNTLISGYGGLSVSLNTSLAPFAAAPAEDLISREVHGSWLTDYGYRALPYLLFGDWIVGISEDIVIEDERTAAMEYFETAARYQQDDGGLAIWFGSSRSSFFASLQAAHYLTFDGADRIEHDLSRKKLLDYIASQASVSENSLYLRSYAAWVLTISGRYTGTLLSNLEKEGDQLGLSGYAYVALSRYARNEHAGFERIYERLRNFVREGAQTLDITETYESRFYFDSQLEQLSLFLQAASLAGEEDDFIYKGIKTIDLRRKDGRWLTLLDQTRILQVLAKIRFDEDSGMATHGAVQVGDAPVDTIAFSGATSAVSGSSEVIQYTFNQNPLADLSSGNTYPLRITKTGEGRLFYSATMKYAVPAEIVGARDEGLSVFTQYETLDGQVIEPDHLTLGETYRCRAYLTTSKRRSFVSLTIPVPSGGEIIDSSFVTSGGYKEAGGVNSEEWTRETVYGDEQTFSSEGYGEWDDHWYWYAIEPNMIIRDNRMIYEWESLYPGKREVSFLFRTTTPGIFPTPPATAELKFEPEVFGRNDGVLVTIE